MPSGPASAGTNRSSEPAAGSRSFIGPPTPSPDELAAAARATVNKERLFANPGRSRSLSSGGRRQILDATFALPASASLRSYFAGDVGLERNELELKRLIAGRRVIAGTILGRVGPTSTNTKSDMIFAIRPPGKGAPALDPEPFIKGWRLLESTAIFRANGAGALAGGSIGQILLMSKDTLARRVLANPAIEIYACGRRDIQAGVVDRRVLATLEFLAANGLSPTVSSLSCGHRFYTETGNVSQHSSGNGVDIAKINGQPILGNQGAGSIADATVRRLLTLQGAMAPAQIISLMRYDGAPTAFAMTDHADHIHVGFRPVAGTRVTAQGLRPKQWLRLVERLGRIANPAIKQRRRVGRSLLAHLAARHEVVPDVEQRHLKPAAAGGAPLGELGAVPVRVPVGVVARSRRRAGTCSGRRASGRPRSASRRSAWRSRAIWSSAASMSSPRNPVA